MKKITDAFRRMKSIEEDFYEIDREGKTAVFRMEYERVSDIIDPNIRTAIPTVTDDFSDAFLGAFAMIPDQYGVRYDIAFGDMEGWTGEALSEVCLKNILLRTKAFHQNTKEHNRLACGMCVTGIAFIILLIMIGRIWSGEGFLREFVLFALDIVATVPFWCAMEICFIDNKENRKRILNMTKRFTSLTVRPKEG